jgi:predicted extracellular nuclease
MLEGPGSIKALELWNCGLTTISLDSYLLCLEPNGQTTCFRTVGLSGTLGAGETFVLCGTGYTSAACDVQHAVIDFNGDDRMALFLDGNGDGILDRAVDTVVDSVGRLGKQPPAGLAGTLVTATPWMDVDLRRKTCEPFQADRDFDTTVFYTVGPASDASHLGVAPALVCP